MIHSGFDWRRLVTLLLLVVTSAFNAVYRNLEESRQALTASDQAFDSGDLKRALIEARAGALTALTSTASLRRSLERISAIAVGSESASRMKTALLARMDLFSATWARAARLDQSYGPHSDEQVRFLIDKVAPSIGSSSSPSSVLVLSTSGDSDGRTLVFFAVALAGGLLWLTPMLRSFSAQSPSWVLPLLALSAWFIGWFVA